MSFSFTLSPLIFSHNLHLCCARFSLPLTPLTPNFQHWSETEAALGVCGLSQDTRREIWGATAAVLHLGNLSFLLSSSSKASNGSGSTNGCCRIVDSASSNSSNGPRTGENDPLVLVAQLLQLEGTAGLRKFLTVRSIQTVAETLSIPLSETDAGHCRDALSRALYDAVFG